MGKNKLIFDLLAVSGVPFYELMPEPQENDTDYTVPGEIYRFINEVYKHIDLEAVRTSDRIVFVEFELGFRNMLIPGENEIFLVGPYLHRRLTTEEYFARLMNNGVPVTPELNAFYQSLYFMSGEKLNALLSLLAGYAGLRETRVLYQKDLLQTSHSPLFTLLDNTYTENTAGKLIEAEDRLMKALLARNRALADEALLAYEEVLRSASSSLDLSYLKQQLHISNGICHRICFIRLWLPYLCDSLFYRFRASIGNCADAEEVPALRRQMNASYFELFEQAPEQCFSPLVNRAVVYLQKNSANEFRLDAMAEALGVNPSYLSHRFHRETGKCILDFLNGIRIGEAVTLLRTTTLEISSVSAVCGFRDAGYFSRVFRRLRGIPPREERRSPEPVSVPEIPRRPGTRNPPET